MGVKEDDDYSNVVDDLLLMFPTRVGLPYKLICCSFWLILNVEGNDHFANELV